MASQPSKPPYGFSASGLGQVEFGFLLGDALKAINAKLDGAMEGIGLTQPQWKTLVQVFRLDRPTQTELSNAIGIGRAATGTLIDQLVKTGHLLRQPDQDDRRIWRIVPTEMALNQSKTIAQTTEKTLSPIFAGIEPDALHQAKLTLLHLIERASWEL